MTRNMVNYGVKKIEGDNNKPKMAKSTVIISKQTCISSLTSGSIITNKDAVDALIELNTSSASPTDASSSSIDSISNSDSKFESDPEGVSLSSLTIKNCTVMRQSYWLTERKH
jgi:hypothetical protein